MGVFAWVDAHFNAIQTVGIVGGLFLTASAAIRESKAREIENLLTLAEHHRELWGRVCERKELARIFQKDIDVQKFPPTVDEEEFLNLVVAHSQTSWRIAKVGGIMTTKELASDLAEFFSFPIPCCVWQSTKATRNPEFVRFVDKSLQRKR